MVASGEVQSLRDREHGPALRARIRPLITGVTVIGGVRTPTNEILTAVLCWAADGKTAWETGRITSNTERNVRWLRERATEKMGACNLIEAVVRALALGLLTQPVDLVA